MDKKKKVGKSTFFWKFGKSLKKTLVCSQDHHMKPVIDRRRSREGSGLFVRGFLICVARTRLNPVYFLFSNPRTFFSCLKKIPISSEIGATVDTNFEKK